MADTDDDGSLQQWATGVDHLNRLYNVGTSIYANAKGVRFERLFAPPDPRYYIYGNADLYRHMTKMPYRHGFTSMATQVKRVPDTLKSSFVTSIKDNTNNFKPSTYKEVAQSANLSRGAKTAAAGGKALGAVGTVFTVASDLNDNWGDADWGNMDGRELAERSGHTVTDVGIDLAASAGCAAAGAAVGSVVPVVGTVVGAAVGFALGLAINWEFGEPPKSIVGRVKEGARWAVDCTVGFFAAGGEAVVGFFSDLANWRDRYGQNSGPQDRDFTQATKERLLGIVDQLEKECGGVIDYIGDGWKAAGLPTAKDYTAKLLDIKNTSKADIEKVFAEVASIDTKFAGTFNSARDAFLAARGDLQALCDRITV
jgi:hypothetical protein